MILPQQQRLIDAVRIYGREQYELDGFDFIEEGCYNDFEILELVHDCNSEAEAIEVMRKVILIKNEVRKDIEAERF